MSCAPHSVAITIITGIVAWLDARSVGQCGAVPAVRRAVSRRGLVTGARPRPAGLGLADASVLALGQTVVSARSDAQRPLSALAAARRLRPQSHPHRLSSRTIASRCACRARRCSNGTSRSSNKLDTPIRTQTMARAYGFGLALRHLPRIGAARRSWRHRLFWCDGRRRPCDRRCGICRSPRRCLAADVRGQLNFMTTTVARPIAEWAAPDALAARRRACVAGRARRSAMARGNSARPLLPATDRRGMCWANMPPTRRTTSCESAALVQRAGLHADRPSNWRRPSARRAAVSGIGGDDRWRLKPHVELEYGARADRFDYLADPQLFSAHGGFNVQFAPRTFVTRRCRANMIAPGADEFLPPSDWRPVAAGRANVLRADAAAACCSRRRAARRRLARASLRRSAIWRRRFRFAASGKQSIGQMATLFAVARIRPSRGQYFVSHRLGTVGLFGWGMGIGGQFSPYVQRTHRICARDVGLGSRHWRARFDCAAPSVLRDEREHVQDLTATLDADPAELRHARQSRLPRERRLQHPRRRHPDSRPAASTCRCASRCRIQPTPNSHVDLLFSIRNLFRDARGEASWYDELLTVGPPLRMMGGIQVRF